MSKKQIKNNYFLENLSYIKNQFKNVGDIVYQEVNTKDATIFIVFIDSISNKTLLNESIISPLIKNRDLIHNLQDVKDNINPATVLGDTENKEKIVEYIVSGNVVLLFSFDRRVLFCDVKEFKSRATSVTINYPNFALSSILIKKK